MSKTQQSPDRRRARPAVVTPEPVEDRRSGQDRRHGRRVRLDLETAVPVLVRDQSGGLQWGLARNISEGGMLIEVQSPPSIGARIQVKIFGIQGSADAPDAVFVHAEVRHNLAWNLGGDRRTKLSAIGVRFAAPPQTELLPLEGAPIH